MNPALANPEEMLYLYSLGAFPMADENNIIDWYYPQIRCIIDPKNYNYPRSLRKFIENSKFSFSFSKRTLEVVNYCADRDSTWINQELIDAYKRIFELGFLHSVEVYLENNLVGGLYGIVINGAFFGESMFSKVPQASKAALIKLLENLNDKNFVLLDVQFITSHLEMFGAHEITLKKYKSYLNRAHKVKTSFL